MAFATKGTVREARGLASITKTRPSRTANCTFTRPTAPSPLARAAVCSSSSATRAGPAPWGGSTHAESPECTPAASTCSMTAAVQQSLPVAEGVDVVLGGVLQEAVDEQRALRALAGDVVVQRLGRVADGHGPAAQHVGGPHQHRVADLRGRGSASSGPWATAQGGACRPSSLSSRPKRPRSSARSIDSGGVPSTGTPSAASPRASRSGVCPPSWVTTPTGRSAAQMSSTDPMVTGSR